jgi:dTDP-4-dehydrorhamnose reductase
MLQLAERGRTGIFHCCGAEPSERIGLAREAADVFELDEELIRVGPPDPDGLPPAPIPYDTTLDAAATAAALGVELPSLRALLERFRAERSTSP